MGEFVVRQWLKKAVDNLIEEAREEIIILSPNDELDAAIVLSLLRKAERKHLKVVLVYSNYNQQHHVFKPDNNPVYEQFPNLEIRVDSMLKSCYFANETKALALVPHSNRKFTNAPGGWLVDRSENEPLVHAENCNRYLQHVIFNSRLVLKKYPQLRH